jgi:hypothetical protein
MGNTQAPDFNHRVDRTRALMESDGWLVFKISLHIPRRPVASPKATGRCAICPQVSAVF